MDCHTLGPVPPGETLPEPANGDASGTGEGPDSNQNPNPRPSGKSERGPSRGPVHPPVWGPTPSPPCPQPRGPRKVSVREPLPGSLGSPCPTPGLSEVPWKGRAASPPTLECPPTPTPPTTRLKGRDLGPKDVFGAELVLPPRVPSQGGRLSSGRGNLGPGSLRGGCPSSDTSGAGGSRCRGHLPRNGTSPLRDGVGPSSE